MNDDYVVFDLVKIGTANGTTLLDMTIVPTSLKGCVHDGCLGEDQFAIRPTPRSFGFEPSRGSLSESAVRKFIAEGSAANRRAPA